jgi:hypothetical protein
MADDAPRNKASTVFYVFLVFLSFLLCFHTFNASMPGSAALYRAAIMQPSTCHMMKDTWPHLTSRHNTAPGGIQHSVWDQTSTYMQEHPSQKSKLFWCGSTLLRQHLQFRVDYAILVEKEYKYARMDQYTHVASKISTSQRPRREY